MSSPVEPPAEAADVWEEGRRGFPFFYLPSCPCCKTHAIHDTEVMDGILRHGIPRPTAGHCRVIILGRPLIRAGPAPPYPLQGWQSRAGVRLMYVCQFSGLRRRALKSHSVGEKLPPTNETCHSLPARTGPSWSNKYEY